MDHPKSLAMDPSAESRALNCNLTPNFYMITISDMFNITDTLMISGGIAPSLVPNVDF